MKYYFVIINDEQKGPLVLEELQSMGLTADTPVWNEGLTDWTPAGELPELESCISRPAAAAGDSQGGYGGAQPPQWQGQPPRQEAYPGETYYPGEAVQQPRRARKRMSRGWLVAALITTIIVIAMAVTCPTRADHHRAIASVTKEWMGDKLTSWGADGMFGSVMRVAGDFGTDYAVSQLIDVDDYFLWSVGYLDFGEQRTRTSIGVLGHVFTFNKENIDQAFNEWLGIARNDNDKDDDKPLFGGNDDENDDEDDAPYFGGDDNDLVPQEGGEGDDEFDRFVDTLTNDLKREGKEMLKRWIDNL